MSTNVVAFSGGKDSTALALRLHELGERFSLLFTATGNELPELWAHFDEVVRMTGATVIRPKAPTLAGLIGEFKALPNNRQRWCTRLIKIRPCLDWMKLNPGITLCVGLRADEDSRVGIYGNVKTRYPLREWGWNEADVKRYCLERGVKVPRRRLLRPKTQRMAAPLDSLPRRMGAGRTVGGADRPHLPLPIARHVARFDAGAAR